MTLHVQNVHRWLISAVVCISPSQRCHWLSPVTQTKLTKVHFKSQELVLASVAAFVKTPALSPNLIIQCFEIEWIRAIIIRQWSQGNL